MEKRKIKINLDPSKINWQEYWEKYVDERKTSKKEKNWDNIAEKFREWMKNDDYPEKLISNIKTKPNYTVLDIGCGEGSVTVPIAKKVSKVTVIERSEKMIELLYEKAEKEGVSNIEAINKDYQDVDFSKLGKFDIIIASRSLQTSRDMSTILSDLSKIGKTIYMTAWGPERNKYLESASKALKREYRDDPSYIFIYNILYQLGIVADVKKLGCENVLCYENMDEAFERYAWRLNDLNPDEEKVLMNHLDEILIKNEDGTLTNENEKSDWILLSWKNEI